MEWNEELFQAKIYIKDKSYNVKIYIMILAAGIYTLYIKKKKEFKDFSKQKTAHNNDNQASDSGNPH